MHVGISKNIQLLTLLSSPFLSLTSFSLSFLSFLKLSLQAKKIAKIIQQSLIVAHLSKSQNHEKTHMRDSTEIHQPSLGISHFLSKNHQNWNQIKKKRVGFI